MSCDEILAMYLRHVSKQVNENYYRTILRFVLLYRECLNEYGWLKRRDYYCKAYSAEHEETGACIDDFDELLTRLKREEQALEMEDDDTIAARKAAIAAAAA